MKTTISPVDALAELMVARIDREAMKRNSELFAGVWANKFFDVNEYASQAADKAINRLKLHEGTAQRVLDVGCGFGYLCLAADCLGHRAVGLDIPHPCTAAAAEAVGFSLISHKISRFSTLPDGLGQFDLIVMVGVNFFDGQNPTPNLAKNGSAEYPAPGWWGEDEYRFLIDDFASRLRDGGRIHIEFNRGKENDFLRDVKWPYRHENEDNRISIFK